MEIKKATRKRSKAKLAIIGPSGSGKTYSALLIGFGLTNNKVGVIDTENHSAELYAEEFEPYGGYYTIQLDPPYTLKKYIDAIEAFEREGFDVIIIDSLSHAWAGTGGLLDLHSTLVTSKKENSFTAWKEITPMHTKLIERILHSPSHIIATMRSKTEYVIQENPAAGKKEVVKAGTAPVQRDGIEYEFVIVFELNSRHEAIVSKDRTGIFKYEPTFIPGIETGKKIKEFFDIPNTNNYSKDDIKQRLINTTSMEELKRVWESIDFREIPHEERQELRMVKENKKTLLEKAHAN